MWERATREWECDAVLTLLEVVYCFRLGRTPSSCGMWVCRLANAAVPSSCCACVGTSHAVSTSPRCDLWLRLVPGTPRLLFSTGIRDVARARHTITRTCSQPMGNDNSCAYRGVHGHATGMCMLLCCACTNRSCRTLRSPRSCIR